MKKEYIRSALFPALMVLFGICFALIHFEIGPASAYAAGANDTLMNATGILTDGIAIGTEFLFDTAEAASASLEYALPAVEEEIIEEPIEEMSEELTAEIEEEEEEEIEIPLELVWSEVDRDYFDDALFIGDSRTVGLYMQGTLENATFFCNTGMSVYRVFSDKKTHWRDGNWPENMTAALEEQQFGKIYVMLGVNELGIGNDDYFIEHYAEMIWRLRELQPDAIIYIQSILSVTASRSGKGDSIRNETIASRNDRLKQICDYETVFYLDVNSAMTDETGAMLPEMTGDGVHLYASKIGVWEQYLFENALVWEEVISE